MFRLLLITVAIIGVMLAVKDGRLLARAGLVGSCSAAPAPAGDIGWWQACRSGRLEGRPDLSRGQCTRQGVVRDVEYWRCSEPIVAGRFGAG